MDLTVDLNLCQGYGLCAQLAPGIFELDDDGYPIVGAQLTVGPGEEKHVREAIATCPPRAISAVE